MVSIYTVNEIMVFRNNLFTCGLCLHSSACPVCIQSTFLSHETLDFLWNDYSNTCLLKKISQHFYTLLVYYSCTIKRFLYYLFESKQNNNFLDYDKKMKFFNSGSFYNITNHQFQNWYPTLLLHCVGRLQNLFSVVPLSLLYFGPNQLSVGNRSLFVTQERYSVSCFFLF